MFRRNYNASKIETKSFYDDILQDNKNFSRHNVSLSDVSKSAPCKSNESNNEKRFNKSHLKGYKEFVSRIHSIFNVFATPIVINTDIRKLSHHPATLILHIDLFLTCLLQKSIHF